MAPFMWVLDLFSLSSSSRDLHTSFFFFFLPSWHFEPMAPLIWALDPFFLRLSSRHLHTLFFYCLSWHLALTKTNQKKKISLPLRHIVGSWPYGSLHITPFLPSPFNGIFGHWPIFVWVLWPPLNYLKITLTLLDYIFKLNDLDVCLSVSRHHQTPRTKHKKKRHKKIHFRVEWPLLFVCR